MCLHILQSPEPERTEQGVERLWDPKGWESTLGTPVSGHVMAMSIMNATMERSHEHKAGEEEEEEERNI